MRRTFEGEERIADREKVSVARRNGRAALTWATIMAVVCSGVITVA